MIAAAIYVFGLIPQRLQIPRNASIRALLVRFWKWRYLCIPGTRNSKAGH